MNNPGCGDLYGSDLGSDLQQSREQEVHSTFHRWSSAAQDTRRIEIEELEVVLPQDWPNEDLDRKHSCLLGRHGPVYNQSGQVPQKSGL